MSQTVKTKAAEETPLVEAAAAPLPAPVEHEITLDHADPPVAAEVRAKMAEINIEDSSTIVSFGAAAQAELQQISQSMLADVKNKDVGPAGDSLRDIVTTIRGFSVDELDPNKKPSLWQRLMGKKADVSKFLAKYEDVQTQIDSITETLLGHEHQLMKDIKSLDLLYEKTLGFYDALAVYISAGSEKLAELDRKVIPTKEAEVNSAAPDQKTLMAQELRDLRAARDDLERRVHDLKLTRQVTMQSLPSIRLVQENDKSLITKINSTLVNTVPLWETQLAQAVTIQRSSEAAAAVKEASDLTNELLTSNAENLRQANRTVRQEMERGVFDIEAIKKANGELIATIQESLQIADEGKAKRRAAEADLQKMETELRETLASAKAASPAPAATPAAG